MDHQNLRHLHALRDFIRNIVEQAERSAGCECQRPPSLLLVGPPGIGKTYLVKQMSNVCEMPLFGVHTHQLKGPESLQSMFVNARTLDYPSLLFLDDIDCIFSNQDLNPPHNEFSESIRQELYRQLGRRKLKIFDRNSTKNPVQNKLSPSPSPTTKIPHNEEDPDNNGLIVVAATSSPWRLYKDHELLSRFRGVYLVGLPDEETRYHLLKHLLEKVHHNLTDEEFWVIADKTRGYTPSDLLMLAKALSYEQFAFLFPMGINSYGEESDEESSTASELTESDTESNSDQVDQIPNVKKEEKNISTAEEIKKSSAEEIKKSSEDNLNRVANETHSKVEKIPTLSAISAIKKDWSIIENESSHNQESSQNGNTSEKLLNNGDKAVEDGAMSESAPNDEREVADTSVENSNSFVNSNCDSSCNVVDSNDMDQEGNTCPSTENTSSVSEVPPKNCKSDITPIDNEDDSDNETKEFELRIVQPADAFKNDNQAVDSGSDSDNETDGDYVKRNRRVNFCSVPSLQPLTVDIDHSDNPNISLDYESSALANNLLSKDHYSGSSPNNILKSLLSSSPSLREERDDDNLNSKNMRNKDISSVSNDDRFHNSNYLNNYSSVDRNHVGEDDTDSCSPRKEKSEELQTYTRSPNLRRRNSTSEDRRALSGVAAILTGISSQLTGVSSRMTGISPQLTPVGSDSSSSSSSSGSSESGSGRRIRINTPIQDVNNRKPRDSDSSLYGKSDTPTIPSSEASSANCNVSGETLECHSDSDERLRHLEDDLKGRRPEASDSEDEDMSGDENEALRGIFSMNGLSDLSFKVITLNNVLNVINRTQKSVSDEEIKKYADFMDWFAEVAKLACPHNSKGSMSDTASSADGSISSSVWSQSQISKKRKGPLKKLGRFLLKALVFILD